LETINQSQHRLDDFQPIPIRKRLSGNTIIGTPENQLPSLKNSHYRKAKIWITFLIIIGTYFLAPIRSNILILGTDYLPHRDSLSRTDTNIILTINPLKPYIGILSIPRDLWVIIPGYGENRINTAYFFAESTQPGSGPSASIDAFQINFGITLKYYLVIKMEGLVKVIDSLGGVKVDLPSAMGGLPAGENTLDGLQSLAFVRERYSADDFSRMKQGQILIVATIKKMASPSGLIKIPLVLIETLRATETNIPWWLVPRLGLALLRSPSTGIDNRTINRDMVTPFTTTEGAQVLAPNWDFINPVLLEMFGQ